MKGPLDKLGGEIHEGDLLHLEGFNPGFLLVRVKKVHLNQVKPIGGADEQPPHMELVLEMDALNMSIEPGKMHKGLVRVIDPKSDEILSKVLSS